MKRLVKIVWLLASANQIAPDRQLAKFIEAHSVVVASGKIHGVTVGNAHVEGVANLRFVAVENIEKSSRGARTERITDRELVSVRIRQIERTGNILRNTQERQREKKEKVVFFHNRFLLRDCTITRKNSKYGGSYVGKVVFF